ncbi:hypothetical protein RUM43_004811 [Polyplax serrata]|uniref:Transmembrane protein 94 n=1 Tax=Polyplax serrata TaxID=468196 RepID=A0AAN8SDV6_POLSC
MGTEEDIGLTTKEALSRLHGDLKQVLCDASRVKTGWFNSKKSLIYDTLHHHSQYTTICWTSTALLLISVCALAIAYNSGSCGNYNSLPFDILIIFILVLLNLGTVAWDNNLRLGEVLTRAKQLLDNLEKSVKSINWSPLNYPNLCTPASPCITLQWTYRDGEVVNLPWALLVRGDVIIVRPGQTSPGYCIPFDDKNGPVLHAHEIYSPSISTNELFSLPSARAPLESKKYILQETPYLRNLRMALDQSTVKPISYHNKERHMIMVKSIEHSAVPVLIVLVLLFNTLRYFYLAEWVGKSELGEMLLMQPISVILPLLPLVFPIFWFLLNTYGMTRIRAILQQSTPTQNLDPFEDTDVGESKQPVMKFQFNELKKYFIDIMIGRGPFLNRSVNILHVLGSVTALCCVDKKGILSWPNPTAEKVFFLRNSAQNQKSRESLNSKCYSSSPQKPSGQGLQMEESDDGVPSKPFYRDSASQTVAEVLDLTHDHSTSFRLQFDDPSWKQHLSSLKPLGLAILLNTCNMATQEHYAQFYSHITCEAIHNEDLVPVTNRRCLCELAKQIGFIDQAQDIFQLEEQLCTFKHVQTDSVRRDIKFAKQLSISTKLKFPFPHMMATVVREKKSGCLQLMSQGTAEVILDSCVEYWDGHDLYPLTPADRKKIMDFYQRSSLTAYCTAFAYRPLSKRVNSKLSQVYLELPADSKHLYLPYRSPTPMAVSALDNKWKGILAQFHSTDSLLNADLKEDEVADIEGCFELQCNQIFIGMVTMQYQAQIDIVQLIEQLERACIRFVHFSKENELRSRVFSEKMGLESGWNCHISLLSERNRSESAHSDSWVNLSLPRSSQLSSPLSLLRNSHGKMQYSSADQEVHETNAVRNLTSSRVMSFSAPSAINVEISAVKFDAETDNIEWTDDSSNPRPCNREKRTSEDSVIVQSADLNSQPEPWRSLSCLTDSTDQSVPVNFDIWNRAKLPRGVENIRPHLDLIDNVPLLVSLFTDCTPTVTKEMLHIMQDYGEVVCVMGSSANCENVGIFMQADASIAVEPLYPQVCQKVPTFSASASSGPSPIELSRMLNSITCAVSLRREDPFSIYHLIMEARHYTQCLMNCIQFWVCSVVALSFLQFLAVILMLPPLFSIHQILYISCALIPLLSVSLVALPTNSQVMQKATGKNQCKINVEVSVFVLWCYGSKIIPSVLIILIVYISTLACFCNEIAKATDTTCTLIYPNANMTMIFMESSWNRTDVFLTDLPEPCWKGWNYFQFSLLSVQHLCAFSFVLHIATTSSSFVHRDYSIWQQLPTDNCLWLFSVITVILMQAVFSTVELSNIENEFSSNTLQRLSPPWFIILVVVLSPILVFFINEGVKWQEIKVNKRFQRRKRLDFGTKLGMNSPF